MLTKKNLKKFIQKFAVCKKKLSSAVDVKIVLFITDLSLFINNTCTTLTMKKKILWKNYLKTNQYGFELKHVI